MDSMERNLQDRIGPKKLGSHEDWIHMISLAEIRKGQTTRPNRILVLHPSLYGKLEGPHAKLPITPHQSGPDLQHGFCRSVYCWTEDQVHGHDPKGSAHLYDGNKRQQMRGNRLYQEKHFKDVQQQRPKREDHVYPFNAVTLGQHNEA